MDWEPNTQGHMLGQVTPQTPKAAGFPCPSLSSQETQCSYSREIKSAVQVVPSCRWLKAGELPSSRAVLGLSTGCCQWEQSLGVHEETPGRHFAMGSKVLFFFLSGNSLPLPRISTESTVQVSGTNAVIVVTLSPACVHNCKPRNYFSVYFPRVALTTTPYTLQVTVFERELCPRLLHPPPPHTYSPTGNTG